MKESRKMELTMYFTKKINFSYFINKRMSNKYLFFEKLYGNYANYFVKKRLIFNLIFKISICTAVKKCITNND